MPEIGWWIGPDGSSTQLEMEWNASGRFMPPIEFEDAGMPGRAGAIARAVRHGVHTFTLPIWMTDVSETALRLRIRDLVKKMNPAQAWDELGQPIPGAVRYQSISGGLREIPCFYESGLELEESLGTKSGPLLQRADVKFRAYDPYYYDTADTVDSWTIGATPPPFFPFFPLRLTSSQVYADLSIVNPGDVAAWPVWLINGPGDDLRVTHQDTGEFFEFPGYSLSGFTDTVTVDTRPGRISVVNNLGDNIFSALSDGSALFPLEPGVNSIRIQMGDATLESLVTCTRRYGYLSP